MNDTEFREKVAQVRAWARNFRLPAWWYERSDFNRVIARDVRQVAQREVAQRTREAEQLRLEGDIPRAEAVLGAVVAYALRLQQLRTRLDARESLSTRFVNDAISSAVDALDESLSAASRAVREGAAAVVSSGPFIAFAGVVGLFVVFRLMSTVHA